MIPSSLPSLVVVFVFVFYQELPAAEGDDAVAMSELLARAEMEAKADATSQVKIYK